MDNFLEVAVLSMGVVELLLLLMIARKNRQLVRQRESLQTAKAAIDARAEQIIAAAQETATRRLRQSTEAAGEVLADTKELSDEIAEDVNSQLAELAHSEKILFRRALKAARRANDQAWKELNGAIAATTKKTIATLNETADREVAKLSEQLQRGAADEVARIHSVIMQALQNTQTSFGEFLSKEEGLLRSRLDEHAKQLAKEVLRRALSPEEHEKLVNTVLADANLEQPS